MRRSIAAARTWPHSPGTCTRPAKSGSGKRGRMPWSSMRSAYTPWSPLAPGRASASIRLLCRSGTACSEAARCGTTAAGRPPVFERVREHVRVGERAPGPGRRRSAPSSPHAWRRRKVVCPSSTPVPNSSNSKMVFSSPRLGRASALTPRRLWRTPANVLLSSPNSFVDDGSLVRRSVSYQFGSICLKSWPMSSIANP